MDWSPEQEQVIRHRDGNLLVSAAAGSGKTKVLIDRVLCYLTDPMDPANLDEFLIITYTKAAASELRSKIAAKLTERIAADPENRHLQKQIQRSVKLLEMKTDSHYSRARIKKIDTERISMELDKKNIVIVAGFQGINKYDDITTLGRGGSDTSAVALAAAR